MSNRVNLSESRKLISDFLKFKRFLSLYNTLFACTLHALSIKRDFLTLNDDTFCIETSTSDIYTAASNFSSENANEFNFGTWTIPIQATLPTGICIVDVGANIGATTVRFARQFPYAQIFAVEPLIRNFERLTSNTAQFENIKVMNCALGADNRNVTIVMQPNTASEWEAKVDRSKHSWSAEVEQLDMVTFLNRNQISFVNLLKINAEGSENEILKSFGMWHQKVGVIAIAIRSSVNFESVGTTMAALFEHRPISKFSYHLAENRILWCIPRSSSNLLVK